MDIDAVGDAIVFKELCIAILCYLDEILLHDHYRVAFLSQAFEFGNTFALLRLLVVDVCLDNLNVGHEVNHLLLTEQPFWHKTFVLVTASGGKDKEQQ